MYNLVLGSAISLICNKVQDLDHGNIFLVNEAWELAELQLTKFGLTVVHLETSFVKLPSNINMGLINASLSGYDNVFLYRESVLVDNTVVNASAISSYYDDEVNRFLKESKVRGSESECAMQGNWTQKVTLTILAKTQRPKEETGKPNSNPKKRQCQSSVDLFIIC
jgi:hypothetical protein